MTLKTKSGSVEKTSLKKEGKKKLLMIYSSSIASALGTATMVSVATMSWKSRSVFMASFSVGASMIVTASYRPRVQ
jgi:hypothetical protein